MSIFETHSVLKVPISWKAMNIWINGVFQLPFARFSTFFNMYFNFSARFEIFSVYICFFLFFLFFPFLFSTFLSQNLSLQKLCRPRHVPIVCHMGNMPLCLEYKSRTVLVSNEKFPREFYFHSLCFETATWTTQF